jgi:hypothetical protein
MGSPHGNTVQSRVPLQPTTPVVDRWDFIAVTQDLETLLHRPVDLVEAHLPGPFRRDEVWAPKRLSMSRHYDAVYRLLSAKPANGSAGSARAQRGWPLSARWRHKTPSSASWESSGTSWTIPGHLEDPAGCLPSSWNPWRDTTDPERATPGLARHRSGSAALSG